MISSINSIMLLGTETIVIFDNSDIRVYGELVTNSILDVIGGEGVGTIYSKEKDPYEISRINSVLKDYITPWSIPDNLFSSMDDQMLVMIFLGIISSRYDERYKGTNRPMYDSTNISKLMRAMKKFIAMEKTENE